MIAAIRNDLTTAITAATTRINDLTQTHVPGVDEAARNTALKTWLADPGKGNETIANPAHT